MARILCTSTDKKLLKTRRLVLEHDGHSVALATSEEGARQLCERCTFDLAIIGHTHTLAEKRAIHGAVRQHCPGARVLEIYIRSTGKVFPDANDWLDIAAETMPELRLRVAALTAAPVEPTTSNNGPPSPSSPVS